MRTARLFAITLVISAVILLFFLERSAIGSVLRLARWKISGEEYQALILQNEMLKLEIEKLRKSTNSLNDDNFVAAELYSRYPFNDGGRLIADAGKYEGIFEGAPVLAGEGKLLGKVEKVMKTQSEVKTIFDPSWRSSVFIGERKVKAALVGGNPPTLQFISAATPVEIGDRVVNASSEFPLALFIGKVKTIKSSPQDPWLTGEVELLYALEDLDKILIMKNFP